MKLANKFVKEFFHFTDCTLVWMCVIVFHALQNSMNCIQKILAALLMLSAAWAMGGCMAP